MKPSLRKGHKPTTAAPATPAAKPAQAVQATKPDYLVERSRFSLPSLVWGAIDAKRKLLGMTASEYLTLLVLKASK